ncbi:MAG: hypothetical protein AAGB18_02380 [Pseudomonadota bacterium]
MGYSSFGEFSRDFDKTWGKEKDAQVFVAWKIYNHGLSQGGSDGLTIGLIQNLQGQIANQGSVFDGGKIFVDMRHWKGDNRWKIFLNDCFILGGVHSHGDFALVGLDQIIDHGSMVQKEGQLDYVKDPNGAYPLKVTQREVLGITSFGYSGGDIENGKRVFKCSDGTLADAARLSSYKDIVDGFEAALRAG